MEPVVIHVPMFSSPVAQTLLVIIAAIAGVRGIARLIS